MLESHHTTGKIKGTTMYLPVNSSSTTTPSSPPDKDAKRSKKGHNKVGEENPLDPGAFLGSDSGAAESTYQRTIMSSNGRPEPDVIAGVRR